MNNCKKENGDDFVARTMAELPTYKKMLTVGDVAQALGISRQTVRRYIGAGRLKCLGLPKVDTKDKKRLSGTPDRIYRIPRHSYEEFIKMYEVGGDNDFSYRKE